MFRCLHPAPPEPTGPDRLHYRSRREGTLVSVSQCALGTFPTRDQKPPELGSQLPSPWKAPPSHVKLDCSSGLATLQAVGLGHRPDPWERGSPSGQRGEGLPGEALGGAVGALAQRLPVHCSSSTQAVPSASEEPDAWGSQGAFVSVYEGGAGQVQVPIESQPLCSQRSSGQWKCHPFPTLT